MIELAAEYTTPADPVAIAAVADAAAAGHPGYGDDPITARLRARLTAVFGPCSAHVVTNGSAANAVALASVLRPWESVICTDYAHIAVDEAGDVERFVGSRLVTIATAGCLIDPSDVERAVAHVDRPHNSRPRVVSITNATERGEVYPAEHVRAIAEVAHRHDLLLHMDGARFANAVVALGVEPRALTVDAGVDLLSLGFTKNGGLFGDVVLAFSPGLLDDGDYVVKQAMQLASRGAVVAASADALLADDRWLGNARHANAMAARLAAGVRGLVPLQSEPQINQVFAQCGVELAKALHQVAHFYDWPGQPGLVRWVTSHATTEAEVDQFVELVRARTA